MESGIGFLPAADPGHLAFGIVNAVEEEAFFHFLFINYSSEESRDPSILESECVEPFPGDIVFMKLRHFIDHAFGKPRVEPRFDLCIENVFWRAERENQ